MPPLAAQLIRLSYQGITQKRPTSKCETRYDRPHPGGEEGTPVADLGGALREFFAPAPTRVADLGVRRAPYASARTQVADLGVVRRAPYAPARTQVADLGVVLQALFAPARTQVADLGGRRRLFAPARAQVADLGVVRRAPYAPARHSRAYSDQYGAAYPFGVQRSELVVRLTSVKTRMTMLSNPRA